MHYITEQLKFREISYPQLKRLPNNTKFVKQSGGFGYAFFTPTGTLIDTDRSNLRKSKKIALQRLNGRLREVALIWNNPTTEQFLEAIK